MTNVISEVEKMRIVGPVAAEFREEAATTRRVLERVPADKLAWRPHPKSMSLGQLALHIATTPGRLAAVVRKPEHEFNPAGNKIEEARGTAEILAAFDQSVKDAGTYLDGLSEEDARAPFTLKVAGRTIFTKPRISVIRTIMLNHVYHHRGQLSVYLRELDVPVPSIYGPSADENPFA